MAVVNRRHAWLLAVLSDDKGQNLRGMIEQCQTEVGKSSPGKKSDETSTSTVTALSRAGPCVGYESLETVASIEEHRFVLKGASDADDLKTKEMHKDNSGETSWIHVGPQNIVVVLAIDCLVPAVPPASLANPSEYFSEMRTESAARQSIA
jgi:hypothetical protein